eukprot:1869019-Ditylum_brightwellii.AAC.1
MEQRMDLWDKGKFLALVEDTANTNKTQHPTRQWRESLEHVCHVYMQMLLQGKLRQAVQWTGKPVSEVLISKHPIPSQPTETALEKYDAILTILEPDVMQDAVMQVAARRQGATGPGGANSIAQQDLLLCFGKANCRLRELVAALVCWLANTCPAWAAYRAIVAVTMLPLSAQQTSSVQASRP